MGGSWSKQQYYWGIHSSLYSTLRFDDVQSLEEAIRAIFFGDYEAAESTFKEKLPPFTSFPVLAIEFFILYERIGYDRNRAVVLQTALKAFENIHDRHTRADWQLLRILLADAEVYAFGKLREALSKARELREWLKDVHCVMTYHVIIERCRQSSNWVEDEVDGDLPRVAELSPAMKITEVRRILQRQGRILDAYAMIKSESYRYDDELQMMPYKELIHQSPRMEEIGGEVVSSKLASIPIFFAQTLVELGHRDDAGRELEQAYNAIQRSCHAIWISIQQAEGAIKLGRRAENLKDFVISRVFLRRAYECVKKLADYDSKEEEDRAPALAYRDRLLQLYLSFEEETMESAYFLAIALTEAGFQMVLRQRTKPGEFLDYLDDFNTRFPQFNVPLRLERLIFHGIKAAQELSELEALRILNERYEVNQRHCPFAEKRNDGAFEPLEDDEVWERKWLAYPLHEDDESPTWWITYQKVAMKVLLRWVKSESLSGLLSKQEAVRILGLIRGSEQAQLELAISSSLGALKTLEPDQLG
ncbi:MAG: hypothetical protein M1830_008754 [Pleopsidium flavum]|nr:MAG: hypothetical protein M1830_008754 [Pleopsidium flavum]